VVISLACVSSSKSFEGSERSFLAAKLIYVVAGGNSRVDVKEHPQENPDISRNVIQTKTGN